MHSHLFLNRFTTNIEHINNHQGLTILYTHGYCSDPWGQKPNTIRNWCLENDVNFYRYELAGHGSDKANYRNADVTIWRNQISEIIDKELKGDVIVVGSSLGGWLSLLAAEDRPQRVKGVLGLAAAPDFIMDMEDHILTAEQLATLQTKGEVEYINNDFAYIITAELVASGYDNQMLNRKINITCPVLLLQGQQDASVDWHKALKISEAIIGNNVEVRLLKSSNHRLGTTTDLQSITHALDTLITRINQ